MLNSNKMNSTKISRLAAGVVALLVTAAPLAAHAQRKSPLEDAPAIRKRVELRDTRFELGVGGGSTITQDYFHSIMLDVRLAFHFNDWLSLAVVGGFALDNLNTGYQDRIVETLPMTQNPGVPREPTQSAPQSSMQQIKTLGLAQLEFAPFTGKYSLFGKLFAHYDFYLLGGGLMNVAPKDAGVCAAQTTSFCDSGWKPGFNFGVGLHSFFSDWIALNVELRDFLSRLDPSGRDVNGDGAANSSDVSWTSTFFVTANVALFLPPHAPISQ